MMKGNNLSEQIALLSETAEFINNKSYIVQLTRLKASLESGTYMLSVMGQFSSGKSRLINNLLERDVLPVHITETTALITLICYGEDEHAEILMNDGSAERLSLEDTLELWQNEKASPRLENASILYLFVNSRILENGLILADTPGINTMIKKHVSLSADIVGRSDSILYVMGKSVTETDLNFIRGIMSDGLDITFVRTHMDALKSSEEDAALTVAQERKALADYSPNKVFFISNEKDSQYYPGVNELRDWLANKLSSDVAAAIEKNIQHRTIFMAHKFKDILLDRSSTLNTVINEKKEVFDAEKNKIEKSTAEMESILLSNKKRLKNKMEQTKKNAENDIRESCEMYAGNADRTLDNVNGTDHADYIQQTQAYVSRSCASLRREYLRHFDNVIADNMDSINETLSDIAGITGIDIAVPETLEAASDEFKEITEEKIALETLCEELRTELQNISAESELAAEKEQELTQQQEQLRSALCEAKEALAEYPEYAPQYIEVQSATHDGERGWRTFGKILDWATLLIPGDVIVEGTAKILNLGSKAASAGKGAAQAGKVAKALEKGAQVLSKSSETAKAIDIGMDMGKIVRIESNNIRGEKIRQGKARKKKEREIMQKAEKAKNYFEGYKQLRGSLEELKEDEDTASFLDYLTFEHWFGQIGKKFDKPQQLVVDREYEEKYYRQHCELQMQIERAAREDSENTLRLLDIKDAKEQAKIKEEKLKKHLAINEAKFAELNRHEEAARQKSQEKALRAYYSAEAGKILRCYCDHLLTEGASEIDELIGCYIDSYDYNICRQINKKREELCELDKAFDSENRKQLERELCECSEHLKVLENMLVDEEQ